MPTTWHVNTPMRDRLIRAIQGHDDIDELRRSRVGLVGHSGETCGEQWVDTNPEGLKLSNRELRKWFGISRRSLIN
jgi:hypothetical protein